nr:HigA family addiction module antitoxin [Polymorphobacter sp.]
MMLSPGHVGDFIKTEIIEGNELTVSAGARILGVTRQALSTLLNAGGGLSPDMALRIEKAFGVKMDTLLRMQANYEIAEARKREDTIHVARYERAA